MIKFVESHTPKNKVKPSNYLIMVNNKQNNIRTAGKYFLVATFLSLLGICSAQDEIPAYQNPKLNVDTRVEDLISRMTLEEKISQMSHLAPAIPRLDIKAYDPVYTNPLNPDEEYNKEMMELVKTYRPWENPEFWENMCMDGGWWNEALHGVARAGKATAFPQAIGMGSTWNPDLIQKMADVTSTEARIHHNVYGKKLTYWSPTINILRDPRWGRTEESYSEDPYLLSRMAVAFVKGMQGDHPKYLKTIATVKHFVANNSEFNRHDGSSNVSERFLREYYFPAFKAAVTEGNVQSVMGAYNAVNGVPACANDQLLTEVLREEWKFQGYVVSDCGAINDIVYDHKYETNPEKAVAMAVKAGTDLECETCLGENFMYNKYLLKAVKKGYITEEDINKAVKRLFRARILLGEFDPKENVPWNDIPESELESKSNQELALKVARESMVLLKNENNILPLDKKSIDQIAVIGPNANVTRLGGYSGSPSVKISPLDGLKKKVGDDVTVKFAHGCSIIGKKQTGFDPEKHEHIYEKLDESKSINEAANLAAESDVSILFVGTSLEVADEEADRNNLDLPGNQIKLIKKVYEANPNTIVVLINGMPLAINWVDKNIPGILEAWYPGQAGGRAISDVLFGDYNPGGKLPVSFYKDTSQLPPIADYDITKNRTYWFLDEEPLYKFGYGLSYTTFEYSNFNCPSKIANGKKFEVSIKVENTGEREGDEVVQLYVSDMEASLPVAKRKLQRFERIHLKEGESKTLSFEISPKNLAFVNEKGNWIVEPGNFQIAIGGRQPKNTENTTGAYANLIIEKFNITGSQYIINPSE